MILPSNRPENQATTWSLTNWRGTGLLATCGAALGVIGAWFGGNFLVTILSTATTNGSTFDLTPNRHILGFTTAVAIGTTLLFGLLPAFRATAQGPAPALTDSGGRVSRTRLGSSLVTIQVALSLVLLIGAGLFVRTLQNLRNLDLGFRREPASIDRCQFGYGEAYSYAYRDIADVLDMQEANARQLVRRARLHLAQGPRTPVLAEDNRRLLAAFSTAAQDGDARGLTVLFAAETRRQGRSGKARPAAWSPSQATQDKERSLMA